MQSHFSGEMADPTEVSRQDWFLEHLEPIQHLFADDLQPHAAEVVQSEVPAAGSARSGDSETHPVDPCPGSLHV